MRFLLIFVTCLSLFADASRLRRLSGSNSDGGSLGDSDNPLTLPNQLLYLDSTVPGTVVQDSAVQFTASDKAYLSIADNASLSMGSGVSFTITGWFYADTLGTINRYMVGKAESSASPAGTYEYIIYIQSNRKPIFYISNGTTEYGAEWGSAVSTGAWYFFDASFDSATGIMSLNINRGTPVATSSVTYAQDSTGSFIVGGNGGTPMRYFDGRMDTLAIWKRVLTSTELDWQYNSGAGRIYSDYTDAMKVGLVSCWDFNEENGTRYDSHSTNHLAQTFVNIIDGSTLNGGFESLGAGETLGSELAANIGFETAGGGGADVFGSWSESASDGAITQDNTGPHGGTYHAKLTAGASGNTYIAETITVTASTRYKLVVWTKGDGTRSGYYRIRDSSNAAELITNTSLGVSSETYTQKTIYFTTPAGCISIIVYFYSPTANTGIAYFDDVSLKAVTASAAFANWTDSALGSSTINVETTAPYAGTYACRIDVDGSTSVALCYQTPLTVGHKYKASAYLKSNINARTVFYAFGDGLNLSATLTTSYALYTLYGTATANGNFYIYGGSPSASFYIDDITLICTEIPSAAGIAAGWAKDGNLCASFNGTSQYLYCNSSASLQTGDIDFTVWGWANLNSKTASQFLAAKYGSAREFKVVYDASQDKFSFAVSPDGGSGVTTVYDTTLGSPPVNTWHFIVAWHDKTLNKIYIQSNNGTAVSANHSSGLTTGTATFTVASVDGGGNYCNGRIQGVGFKKRLLTADEKTALFANGIGLRGASELPSSMTSDTATYPMSYWPLEEYSAGTANITRSDAIGANHLTSVGNTPSGQGVDYYGGAVSKWYDLSGNNRTFTQTTIASRLLYSGATIGNKYSIVGDNSLKHISYATDFIGTGDVTIFAVIKPRGFGGGGFGRIIDNGKFVWSVYSPNTKLYFTSGAVNDTYSANSSIALDTAYVVSITRAASGTANFYVNGVLSGTANQNSGTPAAGGAVYIMNNSTTARGFDGWLQKLIIVNGILSQSKIQSVSKQLMRENGI